MKKILFALFVLPLFGIAQQNLQTVINVDFSTTTGPQKKAINDYKGEQGYVTINLPVFSIFGLANLNQETLKSFNAGGKATVAVRPAIGDTKKTTNGISRNAIAIFASFNKSASNNDSIVHSKLIFPELGSSSFIGTVVLEKYYINTDGKVHNNSIFFEMGVKSIRSDSIVKGERLSFDALNYTIGYKYGFTYSKDNPFEKGKKVNLGFYLSPFISAYNIPDEDREDYKKILITNGTVTGNADNLSDFVINAGVKVGFHFNGMEFFADMRHVMGGSKVPIRELKGFHANIGFVFNADVLNFY
jgi:hypothetical protein